MVSIGTAVSIVDRRDIDVPGLDALPYRIENRIALLLLCGRSPIHCLLVSACFEMSRSMGSSLGRACVQQGGRVRH
jgi:hypothetical protein